MLPMQYHTLANGDLMPAIGLGTWQSKAPIVSEAVEYALEIGYQQIDCAPVYMNEKAIGQAFSSALSKKLILRKQLWVTSKLWNNKHDPAAVMPALKESLHYLQLDYLDAYLIHWPVILDPAYQYGQAIQLHHLLPITTIPLHETWEAMIDCQQAGLVRHIGVSNFSISDINSIIEHTGVKPSINQVECHPYLTQQSLREYCQQHQITITAYAPLGSGGRPPALKQVQESTLLEDQLINQIAQRHHVTAAQVLISWSVALGNVVIPKSVTPSRIKQNLDALDLQLTAAEINQISDLNIDHRFVSGSFFTLENSPYTMESLWQ